MSGSELSQQWENFGIIILQFVGHPPGKYGIWFYHVHPSYCLTVASSLYLECKISFFGGFQCPPVDGISTASWNFGAFAGVDEHMSFYFAILNWKPKWTSFKTGMDI